MRLLPACILLQVRWFFQSAVGNEEYPYVTWTEATQYTGSATNNGGRPLFSLSVHHFTRFDTLFPTMR